MRVIITGGTGLIGRALAESLAADGHEVISLSRSPEKHRSSTPPGVELVKYDAKTAAGWGHLADGADAIVNLAAESIGGESFPPPRWTKARKQRIRQSRSDSGNAVVEAVEQAAVKPRVVIQPSGTDYYGWTGDQVVTEDSPPGDTFLASVSRDWEASTTAVEAMGVRRCVMRSGIVLSEKGGVLKHFVFPFRFFVGGPLGSGRQYYSWVHLDDEVRAIRFLIENESTSGVYNVAAPKSVRQRDLARMIGRVMKRPSFFPAPAPLLRLMLGEQAGLVLKGQRAIPKRLTKAGFTFKYPEPEQAIQALLG
ncbi:MAG TPA: TIGR01777 family oxidoreductase [Aggregatilineales bacterium]|nr:TIGR01777 family oxidoreductase [Aggregatilineales bacterium]